MYHVYNDLSQRAWGPSAHRPIPHLSKLRSNLQSTCGPSACCVPPDQDAFPWGDRSGISGDLSGESNMGYSTWG